MKTLVAKVAALLDCSEAQARLCVDAVLSAISASGKIGIRGFGTFFKKGNALRFKAAARRKPKA